MKTDAVNIKLLRAAGVSFPDAVKSAFGRGGINRFAIRHRVTASNVSSCINGLQRHERIRALLAEDLRVEREWLDRELDEVTEAAFRQREAGQVAAGAEG